MSLDDGLSRYIGRIYEAAYDRDAWRNVVVELVDRTQSRLAFLACVDIRHGQYSKTDFYGPNKSSVTVGAEEYAKELYRIDPSLLWASANPDAGMCDTARILAAEDYLKDPFIVWNRSRFGSTHWRVLYTPVVDGMSFALSLHPPAEVGAASEATLSLHRLIFHHMERAMRLAARPPDLSAATDALFVLDTDGGVLTMSPRAESLVGSGDGLALVDRRLVVHTPAAAVRLEAAIRSAVKSTTLGGSGGGVRLTRTSGRSDWLALVSPCPTFLDHLPVRTPGAILRIVETEGNATLTAGHAALFDLTPRERDVAEALLSGHSLESLCHVLRISRNTAKIHLKSLFRKTKTNRQSELIHLLGQITRK